MQKNINRENASKIWDSLFYFRSIFRSLKLLRLIFSCKKKQFFFLYGSNIWPNIYRLFFKYFSEDARPAARGRCRGPVRPRGWGIAKPQCRQPSTTCSYKLPGTAKWAGFGPFSLCRRAEGCPVGSVSGQARKMDPHRLSFCAYAQRGWTKAGPFRITWQVILPEG